MIETFIRLKNPNLLVRPNSGKRTDLIGKRRKLIGKSKLVIENRRNLIGKRKILIGKLPTLIVKPTKINSKPANLIRNRIPQKYINQPPIPSRKSRKSNKKTAAPLKPIDCSPNISRSLHRTLFPSTRNKEFSPLKQNNMK